MSGVLDKVVETVGQIKGADLQGSDTSLPLELDSINRITLIAELENTFNISISDIDIEPETFETIDALVVFIEGLNDDV